MTEEEVIGALSAFIMPRASRKTLLASGCRIDSLRRNSTSVTSLSISSSSSQNSSRVENCSTPKLFPQINSHNKWYNNVKADLRYYCKTTQTAKSTEQASEANVKNRDTTSTLEDFRIREEQKDREYEEQQAKEESQSQRPETDAEFEAKQAKVNAVRIEILEAALAHVPTMGWTRNAIVQGAEETGYPSVVHGMFPEGGFALVSYFNGKCNEELVKRLKVETDGGQKDIGNPVEFLTHAVRLRLEMMAPYKGQWPQALALIALPQHAPTALAQVLTLVDDICYYSGDRSVDFGWYTRRIGLATILKMTELYMLQDSSMDHEKTWEFLKNRMDEAVQLQMMLLQTNDLTGKFQRSFNSAFITARNILGLGYDRR